jgi:hypothetical protein
MQRSVRSLVMSLACMLIGTSAAHAQATRTWVSGVGDDANPCSRTAPCKTFAGAISKTAAGGEISVLDPGGFGAVTVTKSITINGGGEHASIVHSATNGVVINAGANDVVILRNLSFNGGGNGLNGIRYLSAGLLTVDHCTFDSFTQKGIDVSTAGSAMVDVRDTTIRGGAVGVYVNAAVRADVSLNNVSIRGSAIGVENVSGFTTLVNSTLSFNGNSGVLAEGGSVTIERSMLSSGGTAVNVMPGATIRISDNGFYNNLSAFGCGGGTLASATNNRKAGNGGAADAACAPNATISIR